MNLPRLVLTLAALAAAAPTLAAEAPPTVITTGAWTASKPGARISVPTSTPGVPIMTGAWTPSKPGARQPIVDIARVPVTTGPWVSSKPWARPTPR